MIVRRVISISTLCVLFAAFMAGNARADTDLVLIVHPDRSVRLDLSDIVQIYLKQRRFWEDGSVIVPVNRDARSRSREAFAKRVFDSDSRGLADYWNREYFHGVLPPITLGSDEAVRRFVAAEPRAMGYIPTSLVDETVRVVYRLP